MLELWEDSKGKLAGLKQFKMRWLYYPHHVPARVASTMAAKQVLEQVDTTANDECNPLASVRCAQRVLCCWQSPKNRLPSREELDAAHAWCVRVLATGQQGDVPSDS